MINVEQWLQQQGITFDAYEHPAVYTCEEADQYCKDIPGLACKNLLLRDKKKTKYVLVVMPASKRLDMKAITKAYGMDKASFASAEDMEQLLSLTPGSVSPFGLLNDTQQNVSLCVDQDVVNADIVSFHPNRNTATLALSQEMFDLFLKKLLCDVRILQI